MSFPPQFLDEIRTRVPLESTIAKRVRLARRGRESIGLCPFHREKTPSFTVNEGKGFFHCFGCGAHGDVIGFVMRDEGLSFPEAVERLAGDAGLALPARDERAEAKDRERRSLYGVVETAAAWFEAELAGPRGAAARRYLDARGVDEETRVRFRLGYAPESRPGLHSALAQAGVAETAMLEAGLVIAPDDGGAPYDRFRARVIFPISDRRGRVIAFGGRALGESVPKYLNSPATPLFSKGSLLYGHHLAAAAARETGRVIAVEGYMDVIALHQAGIAETVAPLGTALTEHQLEALWRLAAEPVLCFDGDDAGRRAAARAVALALPRLDALRSLRFASLPAGQDPDTMVRDRGRQALAEIVAAAIPLSRQLWEMAIAGGKPETSEARARVHRWLQDQVGRIPDRDLRFRYLYEDFRPRLRRLVPAERGDRRGPARGVAEMKVPRGEALGPSARGTAQPRERTLLQTLLNHPALVVEQREALAGLCLVTPRFNKIMTALLDWAEEGPDPGEAGMRGYLTRHGLGEAVDVLVGSGAHYLDPAAKPEAAPDHARALLTCVLGMQRLSIDVPAELAAAVKTLAAEGSTESLERLQETIHRKHDLATLEEAPPD